MLDIMLLAASKWCCDLNPDNPTIREHYNFVAADAGAHPYRGTRRPSPYLSRLQGIPQGVVLVRFSPGRVHLCGARHLRERGVRGDLPPSLKMQTRARILSVATAVPPYRLRQQDIAAAASRIFHSRNDFARFVPVYEHAAIDTRYSCVPLSSKNPS
jgi:hypothetical protein